MSLRAVAYYVESDVEKWILQHATALFPNHHVFPFKRDIVSLTGEETKRPDLALIRRDFSAWAIVEVELGVHTLDHVLEQTRVFVNGDYNAPEIAAYAQKQLKTCCNKTATIERLTKLVGTHAPSILVVADTPEIDWHEELKNQGVDLCVFQIYKSVRGLYVYRTSGRYPTVQVQESHCRPLPLRPNLLEVIDEFEFKKLKKRKIVEITYEGYLTRWDLLQDEGKQYLQFVGSSNPLSPTATYRLFKDRAQKYYLGRS